MSDLISNQQFEATAAAWGIDGKATLIFEFKDAATRGIRLAARGIEKLGDAAREGATHESLHLAQIDARWKAQVAAYLMGVSASGSVRFEFPYHLFPFDPSDVSQLFELDRAPGQRAWRGYAP